MYSLILMAAMTSSTDTASFGWRTGCTGCYGAPIVATTGYACTGYSCTGYSCSGFSCTGYSCTGCTGFVPTGCHGGGPLFPRVRNALRAIATPFAGLSCMGYSCSGYSCLGSAYVGSACYGSGAGCCGGIIAGTACYGGCYGSTFATPVYSTGCIGTVSSYHMTPGVISETVVPAAVAPAPAEAKPMPTESETPKTDKPSTSAAAPARLAIELPADAKLYVDGMFIAGEGDRRQFHTPELLVGQTYFYEFKAEFLVDGKLEVEEKRVVVRAGADLVESFPKLIAAAKASASPAVVRR